MSVLTSVEARRHAGANAARIDFWGNRLRLPWMPASRGSGNPRLWSVDQAHTLTVCNRLAGALAQNKSGYAEMLNRAASRLAMEGYPTSGVLAVNTTRAVWFPDEEAFVSSLGDESWTAVHLRPSDRPGDELSSLAACVVSSSDSFPSRMRLRDGDENSGETK